MEDMDRFKAYSGMAEVSRKWVSVMDAKAGFISTLCGSVIVFVWTGAKLPDVGGPVRCLALAATIVALVALFLSLSAVLPRVTLREAFGQKITYSSAHKPISFFGYVVNTYPAQRHKEFFEAADAMSDKDLAIEALEQHYAICHVVHLKARRVAVAGWGWFLSVALVVIAMVLKG